MSIILQPETASLQALGMEANRAAERAVFAIYQERRPINTQRAQRAALKLFSQFLGTCGIMPTGDLYEDPAAWAGITWGLVAAFQEWQLREGYSVKSINDRISTVKVYAGLANSAGILPDGEIIRMGRVRAYTRKEGIDTDARRAEAGIATRRGYKKATPTMITEEQAEELVRVRENSPQARRDALLMCLLLDHGLRVSEVEILKIEDINFESRMMVFYRPKTGIISKHKLRGRAWQVLCEYVLQDTRAKTGSLILASHKTGQLTAGKGMTVSGIQDRVRYLGRRVGIDNLSPHDCRHHAATQAGNDPRVSLGALMSFGGWQSAQSAVRYINRGEADNDGVALGVE
jgi:integrase